MDIMEFLLIYEIISSFLPFTAVLIATVIWHKHKRQNVSAGFIILSIVFALYLITVYHFTSSGTLYDGLTYDLKFSTSQINLIPFSCGIDIRGYILNTLLFVPFGFLFPFIQKGNVKLRLTILLGFLFSLLIEISQMLSWRITDIDDLIFNTLGAAIGCLLFCILSLGNKRHTVNIPILWPVICIIVTFAGRFFLYNEYFAASNLFMFGI